MVRFIKDHSIRGILASVVVCATAVVIGACGSSSSSSASATTPAAVTSTPATTATAPATTPQTTAQTTTAAGPHACTAADLQLSFIGGQGATGHGELGFQLANTSNATCHTYGYPGVLFLDRSGAPLATIATHTTQDFFGTVPLAPLTLAAGATMSFRLGVTHGISSTAGCATAYALQVIPPDDTASLHATIPGGAYECRTVTVSPLRPGRAAYP
jgi:uncharacterized protein DUF4232